MKEIKNYSSEDLLGIYLFLTAVDLSDLPRDFYKEFLELVCKKPDIDLDLKFKKIARSKPKDFYPRYVRLSDFLHRAYENEKLLENESKKIQNIVDSPKPSESDILSLLF